MTQSIPTHGLAASQTRLMMTPTLLCHTCQNNSESPFTQPRSFCWYCGLSTHWRRGQLAWGKDARAVQLDCYCCQQHRGSRCDAHHFPCLLAAHSVLTLASGAFRHARAAAGLSGRRVGHSDGGSDHHLYCLRLRRNLPCRCHGARPRQFLVSSIPRMLSRNLSLLWSSSRLLCPLLPSLPFLSLSRFNLSSSPGLFPLVFCVAPLHCDSTALLVVERKQLHAS